MSQLRNILCLIALVVLFASCSKDAELFDPHCGQEVAPEKALVGGINVPVADPVKNEAFSDDGGEDPDTGGITDDDDDEDDDDDDGSTK